MTTPADDWRRAPSAAAKQIVVDGYELCGSAYHAARAQEAVPELELVLSVLTPGAAVLDIGCGSGIPITATLAEHAAVSGVDISPSQIERARSRIPTAHFIVGDIMDQHFEKGSFDAVVAFYSVFHLPRDQHRELLARIDGWLKPGGHLLMTAAGSSHAGYTEADFFGATMYWSHYDAPWYREKLEELGYEVLQSGVIGHGYCAGVEVEPEQHPFLFGRRKHRN